WANQTFLNCIDADSRGDIAAQATPIDLGPVDFDLAERVGEMRAAGARDVRWRGPDDRKLAGERISARDPVDLAPIGRAENLQNDAFARMRLTRQFRFLDENRSTCSAAHDDTANGSSARGAVVHSRRNRRRSLVRGLSLRRDGRQSAAST